MHNQKFIGFILAIIALLTIFGCGNKNTHGTPQQGHYTADIIMGDGQRTMEGKFYAQQSRYRLEINMGVNNVVVIVDEQADQTYILSLDDKSYRLMNTSSQASIANDPFQAAKYAQKEGKSRILGNEMIQDYDCEKIVIAKDGLDIVTLWQAPGLNWPIKSVEMGEGKHFMELSNIVQEAVDNNLFDIPSDYEKIEIDKTSLPTDDPLLPATTFTTKNTTAPVKTPVKRGEELRVKVNPTEGVYIRFKNLNQHGESECMVSFFLEGKEVSSKLVGSVGYRTVVLKTWGVATSNTWGAPADEVAIRVLRGFMQLEVKRP